MTVTLELTTDPDVFLTRASRHLGLDPVLNTVVASIAERNARDRRAGVAVEGERWYLTVLDGAGDVIGVGMRTAAFEPGPLYLLPMPTAAAVELARTLVERGEIVGAVNGALEPGAAYAGEVARLIGGTVQIAHHTRLFELTELTGSPAAPGRLRSAEHEDVELVTRWLAAFHADADEQAGLPRGSEADQVLSHDVVVRRIESGRIWLWDDEAGRPIHLTGINHASFGAQRIGPVYTPREQRGRGYASAAVAEVSRRILAAGARPCLFTDQANPTSNKIYQAIGYRPVVDMANVLVALPDDGVVTLRRWAAADAAWFLGQTRDEDIQRYTAERSDLTVAEVVTAIDSTGADPSREAFLVCGTDGRRIGNLSAEYDQGVVRVSYWVARADRGHDVASRALELLLAHVRAHHPDLHTATLWTDTDNVASQQTAERAGFVRDPERDAERELKDVSVSTTAYRLGLRPS